LLVEVGEQGTARSRQIVTDVVRWIDDRVDLGFDDEPRRLESILHERMRQHLENADGRDVLVSWKIATTGSLMDHLRPAGRATELLASLRDAFGLASPAGWSVCLTSEPPQSLPASWYEQETILGDYLRLVREYQADDERQIELDSYLPGTIGRRLAASGMNVMDPEHRQQRLRHAAQLGVELLGTTSSPADRRAEETP
jgi:hypothetical protein